MDDHNHDQHDDDQHHQHDQHDADQGIGGHLAGQEVRAEQPVEAGHSREVQLEDEQLGRGIVLISQSPELGFGVFRCCSSIMSAFFLVFII